MSGNRLVLGAGVCLATVWLTSPARALSAAADDNIKLTGCLVQGEGDGGYLLTNTPAEPAWQHTADANVAPDAVGTTGSFATVFYWLDGDGDLKHHVGHRVEVEGALKGDLKDGEIKRDRKDMWTELTVKADGRTLKARVPHTSVVSGDGGKDRKADILVRRVDVEHVRMLDAACAP